MLDFRSRSGCAARARTPYYKQTVDYGRLLMMGVSSVLLLGLIFTFGRPRGHEPPAGQTVAGESVSETAAGSRVTVVGGAILAAALCVVATAMFVLWRMAGPGHIQFAVHEVETAPDFRTFESQPSAPTPREALANIAVDEPTRAEPEWDVHTAAHLK
jgi:hypothetical protein